MFFGFMIAGAGVATGVLIQYLRGQPLMVPLLVIAIVLMAVGYTGVAPTRQETMTTKRLKRPRDPIALAKLIGDTATEQIKTRQRISVIPLWRWASGAGRCGQAP